MFRSFIFGSACIILLLCGCAGQHRSEPQSAPAHGPAMTWELRYPQYALLLHHLEAVSQRLLASEPEDVVESVRAYLDSLPPQDLALGYLAAYLDKHLDEALAPALRQRVAQVHQALNASLLALDDPYARSEVAQLLWHWLRHQGLER